MRMNKEVVMVKLSDIIPNRFQPRLTFDEEALNELASSIKEHGIIQPLILRDLGSKYEIIAGERRYKASTIAGLTEVPAIVGSMDDQTSAELALIENIQRRDLSAIEEAKSYKKILDMGNFTQEELAKRMGKGQSTIANKMRLLTLTNEVQVALMNNLISERHARCLLQIKDEDKQKEVLNKIISERMNVRDTDDYIKELLGLPKTSPKSVVTENIEIPKENLSDSSIPQLEVPPVPTINDTSKSSENNSADIKLPFVEEPKIEESKIEDSDIEIIEPKEVNDKTNIITNNENPNVYTQVKNSDFVDIGSLNFDDTKAPIDANSPVIENINENINNQSTQTDNTPSIDNEVVPSMINVENNSEIDSMNDTLTKVKLATAIRLIKDSVEDIKVAGYNVEFEEVDGQSNYQIIVKIAK